VSEDHHNLASLKKEILMALQRASRDSAPNVLAHQDSFLGNAGIRREDFVIDSHETSKDY
jgi:hypothetical protein